MFTLIAMLPLGCSAGAGHDTKRHEGRVTTGEVIVVESSRVAYGFSPRFPRCAARRDSRPPAFLGRFAARLVLRPLGTCGGGGGSRRFRGLPDLSLMRPRGGHRVPRPEMLGRQAIGVGLEPR